MKRIIMAATVAAVAVPAAPALAQYSSANREYQQELYEAQREYQDDLRKADDYDDVRDAQREYNREVRQAQNELYRDRSRHYNYGSSRYGYGYSQPTYGYGYRTPTYSYPTSRYGYGYSQPAYGYSSTPWYADRYYRDGRYYQDRRLTSADNIYRGNDGRYYCRRSDGTTGLIIGGAVGALIGNQLDRGGSSLVGTLIGGTAGALLGREVARGNLSCS